jgi:hypothetical protein
MQLLRDNLTLWTSDMQGEGEGEKAEGDHISILRYFVTSMHDSLHRSCDTFLKNASVRLFECLVDPNSGILEQSMGARNRFVVPIR